MREGILSLFAPDTVVPEQYFDTLRRGQHLAPEKTLVLAILQDAIDSFQKYVSAEDRVGRERFLEAEQWIMAKEDDWIFSFDNVCALLELDPEYLRRGLRQWRGQALEPHQRQRRRGWRRQVA